MGFVFSIDDSMLLIRTDSPRCDGEVQDVRDVRKKWRSMMVQGKSGGRQ